ncbi:MAG TPA: shikimate dehydrogenase [Candidatus Limnocylindrales bacterium]|nr:shikimate dehydrogenase [Candidatus Limnocylindrales bacterium]
MRVNAQTSFYLLLGNPVGHSLSPTLHNAAFQHLKLNSIYLASLVEPARIGEAVAGLRALSVAGANVTTPYKEAVLPYLDEVSNEAQLIRSVNTIVNRDGTLTGSSTDGPGFYRCLRELIPFDFGGSSRQSIMIIGAGGAARAVAFTLAQQGAHEIIIVNRTPESAGALAELLQRSIPATRVAVLPLAAESIMQVLPRCKIIVYCLQGDSPVLISAFNGSSFGCENAFLFDLRYSPGRTVVMKAFEARGGSAFNGKGMLFWQAALAFELFTGHQAPIEAMKRAFGSA